LQWRHPPLAQKQTWSLPLRQQFLHHRSHQCLIKKEHALERRALNVFGAAVNKNENSRIKHLLAGYSICDLLSSTPAIIPPEEIAAASVHELLECPLLRVNNNIMIGGLPPATSVHELLECPVCTNSIYPPPIHQVLFHFLNHGFSFISLYDYVSLLLPSLC
ncbi:seven-in-absentia protein, partial [Tanacetum coccineum]